MHTLLQDIRYAIRSLIKRPGFLVVAILTLAFGIGANTAIFSVVNAVLLRPLSFPQSDRVVVFQGTNVSKGISNSNMSIPDLFDWRSQTSSFEQIAGFVAGGALLVSNDEPERVRGTGVTADFFPLFRTATLRGLLIQADDCQESREPVAVLSYALWQRDGWHWQSAIGNQQSAMA